LKTAKSKPKLATAAGSQAPRQGACQPRGSSLQVVQDVLEKFVPNYAGRPGTMFYDYLGSNYVISGRPAAFCKNPSRTSWKARRPPGACHTGLGKCGLGIYPNACFCIFPRGFRRPSHASAAKQVIKPRLYNANFQSRRGPGAPTPHESLQIAYSLFT
jgi:hypothetical protein